MTETNPPRPEADPRPDPDQLDRALRAWGSRPPSTEPAAAARAVVQRLPERPRRRAGWRVLLAPRPLLAAAGVLLLALALRAFLPDTGSGTPHIGNLAPISPSGGQVLEPPPLGEGVVLIALDDETDLYLTLAPPATTPGDPS